MPELTAELVLGRMVSAVQKVHDRLLRSTAALNAAAVPYAVIGDAAVARWVAAVDKAAVRNTPEVEILIRRPDLTAARTALESAGFVYRPFAGTDMFVERGEDSDRNSVRIYFAGEKVRPEDAEPNPDVDRYVSDPQFRLLNLGPLVIMNLAAFRTLNQLRIRDLIDVGLVDKNWLDLLPDEPSELVERLRTILADPDG